MAKVSKGSKRDVETNTDGTFHGGFVRSFQGGTHTVMPPDRSSPDIPSNGPSLAQVRLSNDQALGTYPNIKHPAKARQTKLAVLGIPCAVLEKGSPAYARTVKLAQAFKKVRQRELFNAHGYVSSGVAALLAASSLALSASRFLYELAANTPISAAERGDITMPQILKLASSLSDSARQNELSAWELCAREAIIYKRNLNDNVQVPWMSQEKANGEVKRGPGRPRKVSLLPEVTTNARANNGPITIGETQVYSYENGELPEQYQTEQDPTGQPES